MKEKNLCVIGYPKSGTTWLQRLISFSLNAYGLEYHPESRGTDDMNSQRLINKYIVTPNSDWVISRSHMPSSRFPLELIDKVVYIYRDVRDVFTSGYFYFGYYKEIPANRKDNLILNPIYQTMQRRELEKFYKKFTADGILGTFWDQNISEWQETQQNNQEDIIIISYEDLKMQTFDVIISIFKRLGIAYDEENVSKAVDLNKMDRFKKLNNDSFSNSLMRKGIVGDYENVFSDDLIKRLEEQYFEKMTELRYL